MRKLYADEKRSAVIRCYLTPAEKKEVAELAADVDLSTSDLVRLLLFTTTLEQARQLAVEAERLFPSGRV